MYELKDINGNVVNWTEELKNAFKHGITRCRIGTRGYLITESGVIVQDNQGRNIIVTGGYDEDNKLLSAELLDYKYVDNLGFIGQATSKKLTIELQNSTYVSSMENKEFTFEIGADYNGSTYYINYGKFIVDKAPENDDTNGKVSFTAYDYMVKFNKEYVPTTTFPCTLKQVLQDICTQCGVELGSTTFANENFNVENNQYENKTCREVLRDIAKCAFSWAKIGQDNKLYLNFSVQNNPLETITKDDYYVNKFKKANEYFGTSTGIGHIGMGDSDINGSVIYVVLPGQQGHDGIFVIYDNLFGYTNAKKVSILNGGAARLIGLKYMPIQEMETVGFAYLDTGDYIQVNDTNNNSFYTYVLNHTIKYNGALTDSISSNAQSNNEITYLNKNASATADLRTQIMVDRANKKILLNAENISLVAENMTNLTNENLLINSNFATGDYTGWTKRNASSSLYIQVNGTYHKNWLRVKNTDATSVGYGIKQTIQREIPANTDYTLSFLAFYHGDDPSSIIRVGVSYYNNDTYLGGTYTNTDTLTNVPTTYKLKFTTPTNPASKINKILLELTGADYTTYIYWITDIKFEVGNVATEWCANVADHIKTSINLSPESIQIGADNISLAGKNIALTSDNISISSTNFGVTNAGVITAKSGTVGGWTITDGKIYGGDGTNLKTVVMQVPTEDNRWVFAAGGASHNSYADCPFRVSKLGELFATQGQIAGIDINSNGIYSFGTSNYDGFGLWKKGFHKQDNSSIIFHAGGNNLHVGDARFRIYENGKVITNNSIFCFPTEDNEQVIRVCTLSDKNAGYEYQRSSYLFPRGAMAIYGDHVAGFSVDSNTSVVQGEQHNIGYRNTITYDNYYNMVLRTREDVIVQDYSSNYKAVYASAFVQSSSKRYKKNIKDLKKDIIMQLRPVQFDYKEDSKMQGKNVAGLIAEDVEKIDKNLVSYKIIDGQEVAEGIDYSKIIPYLIKQVQDQQKEIDELKEEIKNIKEKLNG